MKQGLTGFYSYKIYDFGLNTNMLLLTKLACQPQKKQGQSYWYALLITNQLKGKERKCSILVKGKGLKMV